MKSANQPLNQETTAAAEHYAVQQQLAIYATTIVQGLRPEQHSPEIAAHLRRCQICQAELDALVELGASVFTAEAPQASRYPVADLSFLPVRQQPRPWWVDQAGQLVVLFSEALLSSLRPYVLVGSTRGRLLYDYIQELGSIPGLNARIEVFASDQQLDMSSVRVFVELLQRDSFDQHGSVVVVHAADMTWQGTTDETGSVTFEPVPLRLIPQLRIEITPAFTSPL